MPYLLPALVACLAVIDWAAVAAHKTHFRYLTKPAVILALLLWLWQSSGLRGQSAWFAAGLCFSLVGDVLLIQPEKGFLPGMGAFLLAQLAYLIGFTPSLPPLNLASLALAAMLLVLVVQGYRRLAASLQASERTQFKLPLLLYMLALHAMVLSALLTLVRPDWPTWSALLVSGGALSFLLSDTLFAREHFVLPVRRGPLLIMITYHLGQALLTLGVIALYWPA
ncbi:MAG: lysoplasmalogenase [Chloroflexota bacterium]